MFYNTPSNCSAPDDYTSTTISLTFTADDLMGSAMCVNITIINDVIVEGNQSFSVSLLSGDPVVFSPTQQATVIITDDNDSKSRKAMSELGSW